MTLRGARVGTQTAPSDRRACTRCGRVRTVRPGRATTGMCRDCLDVTLKEISR